MQRAEREHFNEVDACFTTLLEGAAEATLAGSGEFEQLRARVNTYLSDARRMRLRLSKSVAHSLEKFGHAATRKHTASLAHAERCRQAQRVALRALEDAKGGGAALRQLAETVVARQQTAQRQARGLIADELEGMAQKLASRNQKLMQMMALVSE